jgi:hypothetical protein
MGYFIHHAIVVTGDGEEVVKAHGLAVAIFPYVSPISPVAINGEQSFFVPPDGSKEGWDESNAGDVRRDQFMTMVEIAREKHIRGEEGFWVHFAEVQFGHDDDDNRLTRCSHQ